MKHILYIISVFCLFNATLFGQNQVADTTDLKLISNINKGKVVTVTSTAYQGDYTATNVTQTPNASTIFASSVRNGWYWVKVQDALKLSVSDTASMLDGYTQNVVFLDSISDLRGDISSGGIQPSDTAEMLSTYTRYAEFLDSIGDLRKYTQKEFLQINDTADMLSTYTRNFEFLDSISDLRSDISAGGIQPGDTASMLSGYTRYVEFLDSIGDLRKYTTELLQINDTAAMLASYTRYAEFLDSISDLRSDISAGGIQASDTAAMLTPYISRSDTAAMLSGYTRYDEFLDSVGDLRKYTQTEFLQINDTAAMLAPYSKFDGAYSSLTGKPQHEQLKTTTYITNNYTIQSSDSNKVFINNTTSNYAITINHSVTTSWSKQQIEFRAPNTGYIRILVTNGTLTDGEANVLTADTIFIGGFVYLTSGTNWTIVNGAVSGGGGGGGTYSAGFGLDLATNVFSVDTTASGVATQFDIDSILNTKSYLTSEVDGSISNEIQSLDTARLVGTNLELSLSEDEEAKKVIDLSSLQDGTGTDDQTASEVSITDIGTYFISEDVEGALQEIGQDISTLSAGGSDNWGTQTVEIGFGLSGNGTIGNVLLVDTVASGIATQFDIDSILSTKSYITASDTATAFAPFIERSDTASMLTPYINRSDTAAMLSTYTRYAEFLDSVSDLRADLGAGALQLTDTAAMLQSYIQRGDTASMLTPYINRSDTATMLASYIQRGDTASMLTAYIQRIDTSDMLSFYINRADTAAAFAPFIERSDTASMLTPYISRNDTASMLSYYYDKTEIDSALISQSSRELNQSDTLTTADFGKLLYNDDATNDTLYIPTGLTLYKVNRFVGVESYGDGSVVIIEMAGVTLTDIENIAVDTTIMRATAIRGLGTNTYKILSKTTGEFGWAHYIDTAYATAADSFYVAQGSTLTLPIKADMTAALANNYLPFGVDSLWSQFGSKIIPTAVGATYTVRVNFKAKNSASTGYATLAFDIGTGGTPNITTGETLTFPKGAGVETQESKTVLLYSLDTFVANGCAIKITADTGNLEIYDIRLLIRLDSTP